MAREMSEAMKRALGKLNHTWQSASRLDENRGTLNALVKRGLAEKHINVGATYSGFARSQTDYRLKGVLYPIRSSNEDFCLNPPIRSDRQKL